MKRAVAIAAIGLLIYILIDPSAEAYLVDSTVPQAGGCPVPGLWNLSAANPLNRQWSTSLPSAPPALVTNAPSGGGAQLTEIEQAISASFGAWFGVTGTTSTQQIIPGFSGLLRASPLPLPARTIRKATSMASTRSALTSPAPDLPPASSPLPV